MRGYKIIQKNNPNAVHGLFDTLDRAEFHLTHNIPRYCRSGFFDDKTLQPEDFEIREI